MDKQLTDVQLMASTRTCDDVLALSWRALGLVDEPLDR